MNKREGFTLVELSIVLVIIGIISGAVVGGVTLVHTATLKVQMKDVTQLKLSFFMFEEQYGYLPGDLPDALEYWTWTSEKWIGDGNGDGLIDSNDGGGNTHRWVWNELELAELLDFNKFIRGSNNLTAIFSDTLNRGGYAISSSGKALSWSAIWPGQGAPKAVIDPRDAKKIDKKYDDGMMDTGKITAANGQGIGSWACVDKPLWDSTGIRHYNLDYGTVGCNMVFSMK